MEDNALKPNPSQPLPENEGLHSTSPVPPDKQSAVGSFLRHFGVGSKDGDKNGVPPQPDSPPVPEQTPSDFASRLNGIGTPSMAGGADVVAGPNLASPEVPTTQPPIPPQEDLQAQPSDLGGSTAPSIGEQTIGVDSSSAGTPTMDTTDTTPDLAGLAINTPAPDVGQGDPSPSIEQATLREDAKKQLVSAKESLQQALAAIDKLLGTNLADAPVDITAGSTPKEPVGVGA